MAEGNSSKEEPAISTYSRGKGLTAALPGFEPNSARATDGAAKTASSKQPNRETAADEVVLGSGQRSVVSPGASNSTRVGHGDASSILLGGSSSSDNSTDKSDIHGNSSIKTAASNLVRCSVL